MGKDNFWDGSNVFTTEQHVECNCDHIRSLCEKIKKTRSKDQASLLFERMRPYLKELQHLIKDREVFNER